LVTTSISHIGPSVSIPIVQVIEMIQLLAPPPRNCERGRSIDSAVSRPPGTFDHHRLDAFHVAREALQLGDSIARRLPRGYATLADQLRRALLAAYLGVAEASSRQGHDRMARFRCARGEASEAAAALEAVVVLHLAPEEEIRAVLALCDRLCAMLTRLSGAAVRSHPPRPHDP
jgi:four helix bundle protein